MKTFFQLLFCSVVFAGLALIVINKEAKYYRHDDGHVATVTAGKIGRCILDCPGCEYARRKMSRQYPHIEYYKADQ